MIAFDIVFIIIAVVSILLGIKRGLIKSLMHVAKLLLCVLLAFLLGGTLGGVFKDAFVEDVVADPIATVISNVLGAVVVFIAAMIVLSIAAWFLTKLADKIPFVGALNHILGGVFGAVEATLTLLFLASVIKLFFGEMDVYGDSVIVKFLADSALLDAFSFLDVATWFA